MNKKQLINFLIITFFLLSSPMIAREKFIITRGNGQWQPYEYTENGNLEGFHIELVKKVAATLDIEVVFKSFPWKRAILEVKNGKADAITYIGKNYERSKFIIFNDSCIISSAKFTILRKKNKKIHFDGTFKSLTGQKVGIVNGFYYGQKFQSGQKYLQIDKSQDMATALRKLEAGRISLMIINIDDYLYTHANSHEKLILEETLIEEIPNYLGFARDRKSREFISKFAQAMYKLKKSPEMEKLLKKYNLKRENYVKQ